MKPKASNVNGKGEKTPHAGLSIIEQRNINK